MVEGSCQTPSQTRSGFAGSASSFTARATQTITSSGLMSFAPMRMAS